MYFASIPIPSFFPSLQLSPCQKLRFVLVFIQKMELYAKFHTQGLVCSLWKLLDLVYLLVRSTLLLPDRFWYLNHRFIFAWFWERIKGNIFANVAEQEWGRWEKKAILFQFLIYKLQYVLSWKYKKLFNRS